MLFEYCPNIKHCYVAFKSHQKNTTNIKSYLKVHNECGENILWFVSHYLDDLPPVAFNNMAVPNLLFKMARVSEVCALKQAVKFQANVGKDLRSVTSTIDCIVGTMETHLLLGGG